MPDQDSAQAGQTPDVERGFFMTPRSLVVGVALLVLLVFGGYANSFQGPFIFDDLDSIPGNTSLRHWSTAFSPPSGSGITVSGRPVLNASFALNRFLTGEQVMGFHVGNTLIHLLAALVLWGVVRQTLSRSLAGANRGDAGLIAWFAAALWAVHPLQTESVTYVVQRAESLVGLFYLLALYGFIRAAQTGTWRWRVAAVGACLLGMGTKEVMATAPLVIFLYDRAFISGSFREAWQRHRWLHTSMALTLVLLAILVAVGRGRGGSVGVNDEVTWSGYVCTQAVAIVRYAWLSVWPASLTLDYGTWIERNPLVIVPSALAIVGALGGTIYALGRWPRAAFPSVWFFVLLAPSSSVIPVVTQTAAEHRMYLSLAALVLPGVLAVRRCLPRAFWFVVPALILAATVATHRRNESYRTAKSIWEDTVTKVPLNSRALNNLGVIFLIEDKDPAKAVEYLEPSRRLAPNYPEANSNLGQALVKLGRREEGLALAERALVLAPDNKKLHAGFGAALMDAGAYAQAVEHFKIALAAAHESTSTHYNLGTALMKLGRLEEAEPHFRFTLEAEPRDLDVLNNCGTLLLRMGRVDEAIPLFNRAIEVDPASAKSHNNLGAAFAAKGQMAESIGPLREALRLDPGSLETRKNLAGALAQSGQVEEAITQIEAVLGEHPDADLYNNLGALYGQTGRLDKAEEAFAAAVRVNPNHTNARENLAKLRAFLQSQGNP